MKYLMLLFLYTGLTLFLLSGCSGEAVSTPPSLASCLNIGNSLEAPKDQPWDVPMDSSYFALIKEAGFQTVRLPVRFSDYVDKSNSDYLLNEAFMQEIDSYIKEALDQNLTIVLDFHHFTEIMEDPYNNKEILIAIWKQLAARYKDYPDTLVFELLNEPQKNLESDIWNHILNDLVKAIRDVDKKHYLMIGPVNYNSIDSLSTLQLPEDERLIATIHYYEPNEVTFQGNPYHEGFENLSNITFEGTLEEISYLRGRLKEAKEWADKNQVSLFLGEFGISNKAPAQTRITWTLAVASEATELEIDYGYWEFASSFGIYDLTTLSWNEGMVNALLNPVK